MLFWSIIIIGPIPWGHSCPLCHALSLSSLWTSHAACAIAIAGVRLATPGDWQCNGSSHLANGPNIFQMLLVMKCGILIYYGPPMVGALSSAAVHLSVCLFHVLSSTVMDYGYYRTLLGNSMLEVKATGQHGNQRGWNGNEAIAWCPAPSRSIC